MTVVKFQDLNITMIKSLTEEKTLRFSYTVILVSVITSIFLSIKLWVGQRFFPSIPLFDFLPTLKTPLDSILLYLTEIAITLNIIYFFDKRLHLCLIFSFIILGVFDLSRIQPWYFHAFLMIISFLGHIKDSEKSQTRITFLLKVIISISLIWNGLNKINISYFNEVIPWFSKAFSSKTNDIIYTFSILLPLLEIISPIIIWREKTRKLGMFLIIIIQFFYIFITSPLGYNINLSMLPWHFSLSILIFLLFQKSHNFRENISLVFESKSLKIAIITIAFLPLLNLFNLWDSYLSFNLYSNAGSSAKIYLSDKALNFLPSGIENHLKNEESPNTIDIKKWAVSELGVCVYPEKRAYERVKKYFLEYASDSSEVMLNYQEKRTIFKNPEPIVN